MTKYPLLKNAQEKRTKTAEETASSLATRAQFGGPVHAVCQEFGSNRIIRVVADLDRRVVTPLLKN